jgi:hypothetical protein
MFMEIEARQNNIIMIWSPEEMLIHDLRERAWMAAHATSFAWARELAFPLGLGIASAGLAG